MVVHRESNPRTVFDGTDNLVAAKCVLRIAHLVRCPVTEHRMQDCVSMNTDDNVTCISNYTVLLQSDACYQNERVHKGA